MIRVRTIALFVVNNAYTAKFKFSIIMIECSLSYSYDEFITTLNKHSNMLPQFSNLSDHVDMSLINQ